MSKLYKSLVVAILLTGVLAGCRGKLEETYVLTSLKNATGSDVVSVGFKYSFDSPNVIGIAKNAALIREGNQIEFFIGDDLEAKMKGVEGKKFVVAARKYFSPYIHFVVDYVVAGSDTIQVGEPAGVKLPLLRPAAQFSAPEDYETVDTNKITPALPTLNDIKDKKFKVENAKVTHDEITEGGTVTPYYAINLRNVRFFVDETNDAMLAVLSAMVKEGKPFQGGVQYTSTPTSLSRDFREKLKSGGKVRVGYVIFGGNAVTIQL